MTGIVIDIATGRVIHDTELDERREQAAKECKPVLKVSAPDGRTVFSIERLLDESKCNERSGSFAA
jgi:hypothetical protein